MKMKAISLSLALAGVLLALANPAQAAVAVPTDVLSFTAPAGWVAVVVWDDTLSRVMTVDYMYGENVLEFTTPAANSWYWVGVWDFDTSAWIKSTWLVHYLM